MSVAETPVQYMERTRQYYRALGYDNDYVMSGRGLMMSLSPNLPNCHRTCVSH
ncbi:hypothetical protein ACVMIH_000486 [Bradyrhizobium sp. USDA 4503]